MSDSNPDSGLPLVNRIMILIAVMLASTLYSTTLLIASTLLPQMQGALAATPDEIAWTMTFNILATAVVTPMTGWLVLEVDFRLARSADSAPIRYAELARQLGVEAGDRVPSAQARDTVLKLRASKGMVLDADDRDTWSVGSFFTNPVLPGLPRPEMPHWPAEDGRVKIPAAWLIEHAGFHKGFSTGGGVGISTKHTLALTNRGDGTTAALLDLARVIRDGVRDRFGVALHPEPVLVNCELN